MREVLARPGDVINIGKRGEHQATCVLFDISDWKNTFGDGVVHLLHQRNGDRAPYPCVVTADGEIVRWIVERTDVAVAGRGKLELQYYVGDARVKSAIYYTKTNTALDSEGPVPDAPAASWLEALLTEASETKAAAERAEAAASAVEATAPAVEENARTAQEAAEAAEDSKKETLAAANATKDIALQLSEKFDEAVSAAETALADSSQALDYARDARNTASLALQDANRVASTAAEQAANQTASRLTSQMNQYVSAAQESATNAAKSEANAAKHASVALEVLDDVNELIQNIPTGGGGESVSVDISAAVRMVAEGDPLSFVSHNGSMILCATAPNGAAFTDRTDATRYLIPVPANAYGITVETTDTKVTMMQFIGVKVNGSAYTKVFSTERSAERSCQFEKGAADYIAINMIYEDKGAVTVPWDYDVAKTTTVAFSVAASGGLPAVTTADNDKLLQVVNGKWTVVALKDSSVKTYIDEYISEALGGEY